MITQVEPIHENSLETTQIMMSTLQTLAMLLLGFLALIPNQILQKQIENDPSLINDRLRSETLFSRILVPLNYFVIMPLTSILLHRKFRAYLSRELETRAITTCINNVQEDGIELQFDDIRFG